MSLWPKAGAITRALLLGGLAAAAVAPTAGAYTGPGSFDPTAQAPVYPGTNTPADAWKLVGSGILDVGTGPLSTATSVLIAPRWVMQARHSTPFSGGLNAFVTQSGQKVPVQQYYELAQLPAPERDGDAKSIVDGLADITLLYLAQPVAAPAGGYPLLMSDPVGPDIDTFLPGYTLWAGQGASPNGGTIPRVGWTKPNGLNAPGPGTPDAASLGRVVITGNDSGSGGIWYPHAGARPVVSSTATFATTGALAYGRNTMFATKLAPGTGAQNFATVEDWMKASFADHPGDQPEWTTLADQGVTSAYLATKVPPAPRNIHAVDTGSGTFTVAWGDPDDRIPRTGYHVTLEPGHLTRTVAADATSTEFTGVQDGVAYTATVTAFNDNGESGIAGANYRSLAANDPQNVDPSDASIIEPASTTFTPHGPPSGVSDLKVTPMPSLVKDPTTGVQHFDYCVQASFLPATLGNGGTATTYDVLVNGVSSTVSSPDITTAPDGRKSFWRCGLRPGQFIFLFVWTTEGPYEGPFSMATTTIGQGTASSTPIEATGFASKVTRVVKDGTADYCATFGWDPVPLPDAVTTQVRLSGNNGADNGDYRVGLPPTDGLSRRICNLMPGTTYDFYASLSYAGVRNDPAQVAFNRVRLSVPAGAPVGTALPGVSGLTLTPSVKNTNGKVDYCMTVSWTQPPAVDGFPVSGYDLALFVSDLADPLTSTWSASNAPTTKTTCGLNANVSVTALVTTTYQGDDPDDTYEPGPLKRVKTLTGAPAGTTWPLPTLGAPVVSTSGGQNCVTLSWTAPDAISGFPVLSYATTIYANDWSWLRPSTDSPATTTSRTDCGLPAGSYTETLQARYGPSAVVMVSTTFTVPA